MKILKRIDPNTRIAVKRLLFHGPVVSLQRKRSHLWITKAWIDYQDNIDRRKLEDTLLRIEERQKSEYQKLMDRYGNEPL